MTISWLSAVAAATIVIAGAGYADAHDLQALTDPDLAAMEDAIDAAIAKTPVADEETRGVISNLVLWKVPRKLTICFDAGTAKTRQHFADVVMKAWDLAALTDGRLSYDPTSFTVLADCGASPTQDIRVAFTAGKGDWSYIGVASRRYNPSLNLQSFSENSPINDQHTIHEFGHAIGLAHEHQSPGAPDCKWNFDYIRSHYNFKDDADMHHNMDQLSNYLQNGRYAYTFTSYDPTSIMHYSFPAQAFLQGQSSPCYIRQNTKPSHDDKEIVRIAYGKKLADVQTRGASPEFANQFPGDAFAPLRDLIDEKAKLLSGAD